MPRVQMTPMVKAALYFLRAYLLILLILILIAFIRKSKTNPSVKPATLPVASTGAASDQNSAP